MEMIEVMPLLSAQLAELGTAGNTGFINLNLGSSATNMHYCTNCSTKCGDPCWIMQCLYVVVCVITHYAIDSNTLCHSQVQWSPQAGRNVPPATTSQGGGLNVSSKSNNISS